MAQPTDINGDFTELWIQKVPASGAIAVAGYAHENAQLLFVADTSGQVRPLTLGPPDWTWNWRDPIAKHDNIVGLAAYYHPGDERHHCFIAEATGSIWEVAFKSLATGIPPEEIQLGVWPGGVLKIAGFSGSDGSQQLFVCGKDGLIHPLLLSPATRWIWSWQDPATTFHDNCVGMAAYFHPTDNARHVFIALATGDIWESVIAADGTVRENWLGIQDGGTSAFAGHSATNGTQHLFGAGATGWLLPLQIGPPHWKWRWDNRLMARHDGIVGLVSYFHALDNVQHVFAATNTGDVWESRFQLRKQVATREWNPADFPISYWQAPLLQGDGRSQYQQIADAHFTFSLNDISYDPDLNTTLLAAAGAAGLRMFVYDQSMVAIFGGATPLTAEEKQSLNAVIDAYSGHSALAGYLVTDEVAPPTFPRVSEIVAYIKSIDPGHTCFSEAFPIYGSAEQTLLPPSINTYDEYIDRYTSEIGLPYICFDNYLAFLDPGSFYGNLRAIRKQAFNHNLPFWQFALSASTDGIPSDVGLRLQAMQILAFGGKGVLWFTYRPDFIDDAGNRLPKYFDVQKINKDVRQIGAILFRANSIAVYEIGMGAGSGQAPPADAIVTVLNADDLTLGVFSTSPVPNSSSADVFLVMAANRRVDEIRLFTLSFRALALEQFNGDTGSFVPVTSAAVFGTQMQYEFSIAPGDAQLFRVFSPVGPFN